MADSQTFAKFLFVFKAAAVATCRFGLALVGFSLHGKRFYIDWAMIFAAIRFAVDQPTFEIFYKICEGRIAPISCVNTRFATWAKDRLY